MSTPHTSPNLERFLESVARRLPPDAVEDEESGPLPDDFQFNEETWEVRRELKAGEGTQYESVDAMFKDLGTLSMESPACRRSAIPR